RSIRHEASRPRKVPVRLVRSCARNDAASAVEMRKWIGLEISWSYQARCRAGSTQASIREGRSRSLGGNGRCCRAVDLLAIILPPTGLFAMPKKGELRAACYFTAPYRSRL